MTDRMAYFEGAYFALPEGVTLKRWIKAIKADPRLDKEDKAWAARLAKACESQGLK